MPQSWPMGQRAIRRFRIQGFAAIPAIVMTVLFLLLLATMVLMSRSDLVVAIDAERELDAELAGQSAVSLAVSELLNGQVGLDRELTYPYGSANPLAFIQFDKKSSEPYSTNALSSDVAVIGWNQTLVPKRSIHLVSVGKVGAMRVIHEVFIGQKNLPFAVASAGKVRGTALDVYAVDSFEALADGITEDEKKPGNIVANDNSTDSVDLGTDTEVSGDVRSVGRVNLTGGAVVKGKVKEGQSAQNLPRIELTQYDPQNGQQSFVPYTSGMTEVKRGRARYQGDLTISDLHLDSGLLYVDGNLTITGKVTGNGAIVSTGKTHVTGSLNVSSDLVALVAGGDVHIDGRGSSDGGTRMQGLVYTKGSFKAEDSTVVGAIVSAQVDGTTELDRVNLVQVPGATDFEIVVDTELEAITLDGQAARKGYLIGLEYEGNFTPFRDSHLSKLRELSQLLASNADGQRGTVQIRNKNPDGSPGEIIEPGPLMRELYAKSTAWNTYLDKIKDGQLESEEIFKLDLNSFLSIDGELKMLLWKSYRKPWK